MGLCDGFLGVRVILCMIGWWVYGFQLVMGGVAWAFGEE